MKGARVGVLVLLLLGDNGQPAHCVILIDL